MQTTRRVPRREVGGKPLLQTEIRDGRMPSLPPEFLATCAHMSRPTFLVTRLVRPQGLLDGGHKCVPPDNPPTGTYIIEISETHQEISIDALHAVGFFCEDIDDQLLVLCFPPFVFSMRVNDRLDVILDVLLLSSLVVQGNRAEN